VKPKIKKKGRLSDNPLFFLFKKGDTSAEIKDNNLEFNLKANCNFYDIFLRRSLSEKKSVISCGY
jgi:hypothetical protein